MIITAWSAMSPYGAYDRDFAPGRPLPDGPRPVPDFEPRDFLGSRDTRTMSRATALAVATTARLLTEDDDRTRTGVVLGTTNGSAQSILDVTRASLTRGKPFRIRPTSIINAAMNSVASQTALWHGLKGPNATLAGGRPTGLSALGYCRRLLRAGRADTLLSGAAEELTEARSWADDGSAPLAEGCAVLRLEAGSAGGLAEVLAVASVAGGDAGPAVRDAAERALSRASAGRVWVAAGSGTTDDAESKAVMDVCPEATMLPPLTASLGQLHAATGSFQLAAVLTHAATADSAGRYALLTGIEPGGTAVAAVLRFKGESVDA
jgi:3-oxoacyl-[acyl-carrier-protein] synthase II